MFNHAPLIPSSAAASAHAPATTSLALLEARQRRDALKLLFRKERAAMAEFLVALADFDRLRGWEPLGHASLFAFLNVELGLSKGAAYVRSSAARLIRSFPDALVPLKDGRLCLSSVAELARVATPGNFTAVLPRFFGCSSREARVVAAAIAPCDAPPLRDQVTRVVPSAWSARQELKPLAAAAPTAEPRFAPSPAAVAGALTLVAPIDFESVRAHEPDLTQPARGVTSRDEVEPLTSDLRRLHVTVNRQFLEELETARAGLSHAIPNATTEQVLQAALRLLLERQAKARGQLKRPLATPATAAPLAAAPPGVDEPGAGGPRARATDAVPLGSEVAPQRPSPPPALISTEPPSPRRTGPREAIPAAVRRAVWARDVGRCSWPLDGGGVCGSTRQLELDHVVPWARFGGRMQDNLRLVCRRHNALAARMAFGARWMGRYQGGQRAT
jgi:hypothetical protein